MGKVTVRQEKVVIPTYETAKYDKNPMFLEKRVYQGSSGKVYPHPVCEGVSDEKMDKEYNAIFLENDYILVMILPEIGGRVQRLYDKTNGYDAVYYNEVIKPALVGLAGPWISGGIEFNWPQHHRPSTFDPVDYAIRENEDGSVTVWTGETEKMFHMKGMAGFTVYPDRAYLEIKGQVYNPTDSPQTFLWWANPAVAVNDDTQSVFPPDVHAVMDHGKRDVSEFPIAKGVYYKVDYAPGTDISRYKNIPVPTSYMAYRSDYDFIGNYDDKERAGLLHIADHHISPGKKQWTWGNGDFGRAWDRNLTDENGPYIELMTGVFTDNQPDFTYLKPYEEKTFVQYFMPYKEVGAVKNASIKVIMNLELEKDTAKIKLYFPERLGEVTVELLNQDKCVFTARAEALPTAVFEKSLQVSYEAKQDITLRVVQGGRQLLSYTPAGEAAEPVPSPAEALPVPEQVETNEQLFLAATHLEQYRHATYSPEPYYLEGLRRDPSDIRLNNGYGKWLMSKGRFADSEHHFRAAVKAATWKNPNPYDCEPYYNLGLSLKMQGRIPEAYDMFYKAAWDGNIQDKAFYQLACIAADREEALAFVEKSLVRGAHNMQARTLKTALLRLCGRTEEAAAFAKESEKIDALDHGCYWEQYRLVGDEGRYVKFSSIMRGENHNYIELALTYQNAGLYEEAAAVLKCAPDLDEPMCHYYLFAVTDDGTELKRAESASPLYCFPNRLADIFVLEKAIESGGQMAKYYLGNLFYDRGRYEEAAALWESCADKIGIPTVYRNLSLAYYNKQREPVKARRAMEKAFSMDRTDARVFFELDQLYKILNLTVEERLGKMEAHAELLEKRDDLYTEYITLLNITGKYEKAYRCIESHKFHPWEGGEGKIPAQYRKALINLAKKSGKEAAVDLLERALIYPHNLGEGKLAGNTDSDIYYRLGCLYESMEKEDGKAGVEKAGTERTGTEKAGREQADRTRAGQAFRLAARGNFELSSAKYYNDQPPEMTYYAAKALEKLGDVQKADELFKSFIEYGESHMQDEAAIDYFAVSLPDFLIFEADLKKKNQVHCYYMMALGYLGEGDLSEAMAAALKGLELDRAHIGLNDIVKELEGVEGEHENNRFKR